MEVRTTPSPLVEACSVAEPALTVVAALSPSRLVHNEAPKPYFFLGNSIWAHQSSQWLRLDLNGGLRSNAL
jgi:hypothetical protein